MPSQVTGLSDPSLRSAAPVRCPQRKKNHKMTRLPPRLVEGAGNGRIFFGASSPGGDSRPRPIKGKLAGAPADASMDPNHSEASATPSPTPESDDLYWGPEYEARTSYLGGSQSPQPSEGDLEREKGLREALQEELLREIRARVSVCCLALGFCLFCFQVYHPPPL